MHRYMHESLDHVDLKTVGKLQVLSLQLRNWHQTIMSHLHHEAADAMTMPAELSKGMQRSLCYER